MKTIKNKLKGFSDFIKKNWMILVSTLILVVAVGIFLLFRISSFGPVMLLPAVVASFAISILSLLKKDPVQWSIFGVSVVFLLLSILLFNLIDSSQTDIATSSDNIFKYCWDKKGIRYFKEKGDWIAIVIAFISMVYAVFTWQSQRDTQRNTQGITPEVQKGILIDYGRHYYRNVIALGAVMHRMQEDMNHYPSEDHILKLQTDDRSIYPEAFDHNESACSSLHKFKLNIRNGNIEIKTALTHLKIQELPDEYKERDLNKLMSRMDYIMQQAVANICVLYSQSREYTANEMLGRLNEVLEKDSHNKGPKIKEALKVKEVKEHAYYNGIRIKNGKAVARGFVRAFFPDKEDLKNDKIDLEGKRKILQLDDMPAKDRNKEKGWEIKDKHTLLDYVNAEIQIMLDANDENAVIMMPFV